MTQFSDPVPYNPEKPHWLHDQDEMPDRPDMPRRDAVRFWIPFALGILFSLGAVALAFQTRASWDSHRDWVVPVTIPILVLGGLAFGYLAARLRLKELTPAILLLSVALLLTLLNYLRGEATEGEDGLRDAMSIINGVLLGAVILWTVIAFAWTEYKDPVKPPPQEM